MDVDRAMPCLCSLEISDKQYAVLIRSLHLLAENKVCLNLNCSQSNGIPGDAGKMKSLITDFKDLHLVNGFLARALKDMLKHEFMWENRQMGMDSSAANLVLTSSISKVNEVIKAIPSNRTVQHTDDTC